MEVEPEAFMALLTRYHLPLEPPRSAMVENRAVFDPVTRQLIGYRQQIMLQDNSPPIVVYERRSRFSKSIHVGAYSITTTCNSTAALEVLALEMTWGLNGPPAPVRVDSKVGAGAWTPQFGGSDLTVGATSVVDISAGGSLLLNGRVAYPDFAVPTFHREIPSDDLNNAIVLVNGDNFFTIANQKGVHPPYGNQVPIPALLSGYINSETGLVTLASDQTIIAYELGTRNPLSIAFDFNDVIIKITTPCAASAEVVLRDSITPQPAICTTPASCMTDGNYFYLSGGGPGDQGAGGTWSLAPITVTATENVTLKELRAIITSDAGPITPENWDYQIRVWDSQQAMFNSPTLGNILGNMLFGVPTQGPTTYGHTGYFPPFEFMDDYDVRFNIQPAAVQVLAQQSISIGLAVIATGSPWNSFDIMESAEQGQTDLWSDSDTYPQWLNASDAPNSHSGRYAYRLSGTSF
jgi:hypothetical protein